MIIHKNSLSEQENIDKAKELVHEIVDDEIMLKYMMVRW